MPVFFVGLEVKLMNSIIRTVPYDSTYVGIGTVIGGVEIQYKSFVKILSTGRSTRNLNWNWNLEFDYRSNSRLKFKCSYYVTVTYVRTIVRYRSNNRIHQFHFQSKKKQRAILILPVFSISIIPYGGQTTNSIPWVGGQNSPP